jgi:hypothetical protein
VRTNEQKDKKKSVLAKNLVQMKTFHWIFLLGMYFRCLMQKYGSWLVPVLQRSREVWRWESEWNELQFIFCYVGHARCWLFVFVTETKGVEFESSLTCSEVLNVQRPAIYG